MVHLAHIDNLVSSQRILKILSLTLRRKFAIKLSLKNSTTHYTHRYTTL